MSTEFSFADLNDRFERELSDIPAPARAPVEMRLPAGLLIAAKLIPIVVGTTLVFLMFHYAVTGIVGGFDRDGVRKNLRTAFEREDISVFDSAAVGTGPKVKYSTDCLVYDAAVHDREELVPSMMGSQRVRQIGRLSAGRCEALRNWLIADPVPQYKTKWQYGDLFGLKNVAAMLLLVMPVSMISVFLSVVVYLSFGAVIALGVASLVKRPPRGWSDIFGRRELSYALVAGCVLLTFGLPSYAGSIAHAPSIICFGLLLLLWSALDQANRLDLMVMTIIAAFFGLIVADLNWMTGYIPLGAAWLLVLCALARDKEDRPGDVLTRAFMVEGAYVGSILLVLGLNIVVSAAALATADYAPSFFAAWADVQASADTSSVSYAILDLPAGFARHFAHAGIGPHIVNVALLLLSAGVLLFGALQVVLPEGVSRAQRLRMIVILASLVPLVFWMLVYPSETIKTGLSVVRFLSCVHIAAVGLAICLVQGVLNQEPDTF